MTSQQRNIIKIAALIDIVVAIGMIAATLRGALAIPIVVPLLLGLSGVALYILVILNK